MCVCDFDNLGSNHGLICLDKCLIKSVTFKNVLIVSC